LKKRVVLGFRSKKVEVSDFGLGQLGGLRGEIPGFGLTGP